MFLCVFSTGTATRSPYLLPVSQHVRTCIHLHFVYRGNLRAQVERSILASFLKRGLSVACVPRGMGLMGKGNGLIKPPVSNTYVRQAGRTLKPLNLMMVVTAKQFGALSFQIDKSRITATSQNLELRITLYFKSMKYILCASLVT